jgi:PPOX class probable F420-dependent enzyme
MARRLTAMTRDEWRAFLESERTAVVSSSGADGFPHLVAMWYLPREDGLWMWSYAKSQKVRNLRRTPRVGVLVEAGERYEQLRGVLIQADVDLYEDFETVLEVGRTLHVRYTAAEPVDASSDPEASLRSQALKRVAIRVPYTRIRSWDHRKLAGR